MRRILAFLLFFQTPVFALDFGNDGGASIGSGSVTDANINSAADILKTQFTLTLNGGGSAITTGFKSDSMVRLSSDMTVQGWEVTAAGPGSLVVDIYCSSSISTYPPAVANTITGTDKPTLVSVIKSTSAALTGWTTALNAGQWCVPNVDSVTTTTAAVVAVYGIRR